MEIFETHAHLDSKEFNKDRDQVIQKCLKYGVNKIINIGCDEVTSQKSIDLADQYDFIYATVGYHPHEASSYNEQAIEKMAKHPKVVAIGEIGLDYYRNHSAKKDQINAFNKQIELAIKLNLPIVIHDREAHEDCLDILKNHKPKNVVYHCYSGDVVYAEKILQENWKISITGVVTYKNAFDLKDVVRMLPDDSFFVETDCPYLTPVPYRGKRNAPYYIPEIVHEISRIRMQSPKQIAEMTYRNAKKFFLNQ